MPDKISSPPNPSSKSRKVEVDHDQNLIWIPGRDQPDELIRPITQRVDRDGIPYQHQASVDEMVAADIQHQRCMRFVRDAMAKDWRCTQCGKVRPGVQLTASPQLTALLGEMLSGPHRVDWGSIVDHLHEHLLCPDKKCQAPCEVVQQPQ